MLPIEYERVVARRRRGKKLMIAGLASFALFLAAMFATQRLVLLAPAFVCWLFTCGAAAYTGRAPHQPPSDRGRPAPRGAPPQP